MTVVKSVHRFWRRRMDDPMAALLIFFGVGLIIGYWNPYFGGGFLIGGATIPRSIYANDRGGSMSHDGDRHTGSKEGG